MKTTIALLFLIATAGALFAADDATPPADAGSAPAKKPACCAAKPAPASCCADEPAATATVAARPLSARSLYQLESTWTNDAGRPVSLAALRGRPVVLTMFFASCEYACPVLVSDMKRLRALLPEGIRDTAQFVLVSFDTVRDTPAALARYRTRAELTNESWTLLHGDEAAVQELAMLLGVKYKQDARGQFSHSNLITVLNAEGEITHQHVGLMGDVSEAAKAVVLAATGATVAAQ